MSAVGHQRTFLDVRFSMNDVRLPPKADMCSALGDVCFGPIEDMKATVRNAGRAARIRIRTVRPIGLCLLSAPAGQFFLQFLLYGLKVETRTLLHRREFEQGLSCLRNLVLYKDKAPEFIGIPVVVID
jgi:hypothetical protein